MKNAQSCGWLHDPPELFEFDDMQSCPNGDCADRRDHQRFCSDGCLAKHWEVNHMDDEGDGPLNCPTCGDSWSLHDAHGCSGAGCQCKVGVTGPGVCPACGTRRSRIVSEETDDENRTVRIYRCECGEERETIETIVPGSLYVPPRKGTGGLQ